MVCALAATLPYPEPSRPQVAMNDLAGAGIAAAVGRQPCDIAARWALSAAPCHHRAKESAPRSAPIAESRGPRGIAMMTSIAAASAAHPPYVPADTPTRKPKGAGGRGRSQRATAHKAWPSRFPCAQNRSACRHGQAAAHDIALDLPGQIAGPAVVPARVGCAPPARCSASGRARTRRSSVPYRSAGTRQWPARPRTTVPPRSRRAQGHGDERQSQPARDPPGPSRQEDEKAGISVWSR